MKSERLELCRWEDDEFVIEIDGFIRGDNVPEKTGQLIINWLKTLPDELVIKIKTKPPPTKQMKCETTTFTEAEEGRKRFCTICGKTGHCAVHHEMLPEIYGEITKNPPNK